MAEKARARRHHGNGLAANMVVMAEHKRFARSFDALFAEGMALADKVTADFDRSAAGGALERLPPAAAEFYARERKKLGAAALKMAAWLWVERALREGDISPQAAAREKQKLDFAFMRTEAAEEARGGQFAALPPAFRRIYAEIEHFIARIQLMDKEISGKEQSRGRAAAPRRQKNAVSRQWQALSRAFGNGRG